MFIYAVAKHTRLHCDECTRFNAQYEHVRAHVAGMYLNIENARKKARSMRGGGFYVVRWKVQDAPEGMDTIEVVDGEVAA